MFAGVFIPTGVLKLNPCLEKEEKRKTDVFISSTIEFICLVQRFRCRLQQVMKCQWQYSKARSSVSRWKKQQKQNTAQVQFVSCFRCNFDCTPPESPSPAAERGSGGEAR